MMGKMCSWLRSKPDGSAISGPFVAVDALTGSSNDSHGSVALTDDDRMVVSWNDGSNVHLNVFDINGSVLLAGEASLASPDAFVQSISTTSMDVNENNILAIGFELAVDDGVNPANTEVGVLLYDLGSGSSDLQSSTITLGDQSSPSVSWGTENVLIVAYHGEGAADVAGVYAQKYRVETDGASNPYARALGAEFLVNETTSGAQEGPSVAALDSANFVVVWNGEGVGDNSGVFARQFGNQTAFQISGTVSEQDFVDDGSGNISLVQQNVFAGAVVSLYRDDGDGIIGADDQLVQQTVTDSSGLYTFDALSDDFQYWVVIDSKSLEPSDGLNGTYTSEDAWAEQVYGDGAVMIGGLAAGVSDDASNLLTAQHVSGVSFSGTNVTDVDFGFSFNVVTNTLGGDLQDDDVASNQRSVQGSLRQFITNANAIVGGNDMHFVPGVVATESSGVDSWWEIAITDALPTIEDADTIIDGRAYSADGVTRLNSNTTLHGSTDAVGVGADGVLGTGDEHFLNQVEGVELEIVDAFGVANGITVDAADIEIGHISIHGFGQTGLNGNIVVLSGGDRVYIHNNLIGSPANSFSFSPTAVASNIGILAFSADFGEVESNLIGFTGASGIKLVGASDLSDGADNWTIENNEVRGSAHERLGQDGVDIIYSSNALITNNLISDSAGFGFDSYGSVGGHTLLNNTIENNGYGMQETGGVRLYGTGNVVQNNEIVNNEGGGVIVVGENTDSTNTNKNVSASTGNEITQNAFGGNSGIAIDQVAAHSSGDLNDFGDGVSENGVVNDVNAGNDGFDYPELGEAYIDASGLHLVGNADVTASFDRFEVYLASSDAGDVYNGLDYGEGSTYLGDLNSIVLDALGNFDLVLPLGSVPVAVTEGMQVTLIAIEVGTGNTSEFSNVSTINYAPNPLDSSVRFDEDTTYEFTLADFGFSDTDHGAMQSIFIESVPTGGILMLGSTQITGPTTVTASQFSTDRLTFTPTTDGFGNGYATFAFRVNDGVQTSSSVATMTINVDNVNDAPLGVDDAYSVDEDNTLVVGAAMGVLSNDLDIDPMETLAMSNVVSAPAHGILAPSSDGSFTYIPTANFHGVDFFTYEVSDGSGATATATVTITVNPINDDPVAVNQTEFVDEDNVLNGNVSPSVNDDDNDALTYTLINDVTDGILDFQPDGIFTYTPDANFNGIDSFTYEVSDGNGGVDTATVVITVNAVNDDPIAMDSTIATAEEMPVNGDLSGSATDLDGDLLAYTVDSDVSHGSLTLNSDGTFTYTPEPHFNGTDLFVYQVNDGNGGLDTAVMNITVSSVNNRPDFVGPATIFMVEDSPSMNLDWSTWFTDVDGDSLAIEILGSSDSWLTYSEQNGGAELQLATEANQHGTSQIFVRATDPGGLTQTSTISVDVSAVNDTVAIGDQTLFAVDTQPINGVLLNQTVDVDGENLVVVVTQPSSDGQLTVNADGTFVFDPNDDFTGLTEFRFVVSDGVADSAEGVVSIEVEANFLVAPTENVEASAEDSSDNETAADTEATLPATGDSLIPFTLDQEDDAPITPRQRSVDDLEAVFQPNVADEAGFTLDDNQQVQRLILRSVTTDDVVARFVDFELAGMGLEPLSVVAQPGLLWQELDEIRQEYDYGSTLDSLTVGSVGTVTSSLIVGYVIWALRSGLLMSTMLAAMPAWNLLDPLAIVPISDNEDSDGETLEDIVKEQKQKISETSS